jgi:ketosteroid isomerase-like protein
MSSDAEEALDIAKDFVSAMSRRDSDSLIALLGSSFVMEAAYPIVPGEDRSGTKRSGFAASCAFFRNIPNLLASIRFHNVIWRTTSDGLVVFEASGDMQYPDGRQYSNTYLWLFAIVDRKITWLKEYYNPVIWARANGRTLDDLP